MVGALNFNLKSVHFKKTVARFSFPNITSADIKTKSADVFLKMTTILKEMMIPQLFSKTEWTLDVSQFHSIHEFLT